MQKIISCDLSGSVLAGILNENHWERMLLVCDGSFPHLPFGEHIRALPQIAEVFSSFVSNPTYESVCEGVNVFRRSNCDGVLAVGGGSAIDVAKCIKLFCRMDASHSYLEQEKMDNGVPLIAIPTTAGTGSESTRYAVIYLGEQKQSITHDSIVPCYALLDASALRSLPLYQKKCTMLDAICQAIESYWSVNSTVESRGLSRDALVELLENRVAYLTGDSTAARRIMHAANLAGQAINITQTTAAHAMSYRLTKLFHLPHGHAVAICLPGVWRYIAEHASDTIDPRGELYLLDILQQLVQVMGCTNSQEAASAFARMLGEMDILPPRCSPEQLVELAYSVNPDRLHNTPVSIATENLRMLYAHLEDME